MRAVVQDRYGPPEVLRIEEVERPVPEDDEVLIRVRASTVTQTDTHARRADPILWRLIAGLRRPRWRTLGVELAGEVEAVGSAVRAFKVGDAVFGGPSRFFGAHAEYVCVRETAAHRAQAGEHELRRGGGGLRRCIAGAGDAAAGRGRGRADGS